MESQREHRGTDNSATDDVAPLLAECRRGNPNAWDRLVARYERLVFAVARREGLTDDDAADVTQTTFEALLAQLDRLRDDEQVASWLMTVSRRQAWRTRTERNRQVPSGTVTSNDPSVGEDPIADRNTELWIHESLHRLGQPCRELLLALYFEPAAPTYAQVAARMGRPVGSIGPTRARCLQNLRKLLTEGSGS